MKQFQKKALANSQMPDLRSLPKASISPWPDMKWAFALALVILLLVMGSTLFFRQAPLSVSEEVYSFAVLKGKATILSSSGPGESSAANSEQMLAKETRIAFNSDSEPVELQYKNGGKVFLTGLGQMKVLKDGLNVETGKFNAKFKNLAGVLKVRVPCAVLAIRGTEIQFNIRPPAAEILLVEGAVDLIPDDTKLKTIRLEKGKQVLLASNTWTLFQPKSQDIPKNAPSENLASDSQPANGNNGSNIPEQINDEKPTTPEEDIDTSSTTINENEGSDLIGREGFRGN